MRRRPSALLADEELVARSIAGDHRSFATLLQRHDPAMRRLAGRLLGGRSAMDDALQDAYTKAYRKLDTFDQRSRFSTWLYSVTYRTCVDHLRARERRQEIELDPVSGHVQADIADSVAAQSELRRALQTIAPDQAAVVLLVDGEGHSYQETATILGISPGTVGSRLNRGRAALRARIDADIDPGEDEAEGGGR